MFPLWFAPDLESLLHALQALLHVGHVRDIVRGLLVPNLIHRWAVGEFRRESGRISSQKETD